MSRLPIPDDWDEPVDGYAIGIVCLPNSVMWRAIVRGSIYNLVRGRNWDETTGTITDVQAIALEIFDGMCVVDCQALIDAIEGLSLNPDIAELTKAIKEMNAILASQSRDLTLAVPDAVDHTSGGVQFPLLEIDEKLGPHVP